MNKNAQRFGGGGNWDRVISRIKREKNTQKTINNLENNILILVLLI